MIRFINKWVTNITIFLVLIPNLRHTYFHFSTSAMRLFQSKRHNYTTISQLRWITVKPFTVKKITLNIEGFGSYR